MRTRNTPQSEARQSAKRSTKTAFASEPPGKGSLRDERDGIIATVHELYGRGSEIILRILDDMQSLDNLHRETTELLCTLRTLPSECPRPAPPLPKPVLPSAASGTHPSRLLGFREVVQRVGLSRSSVWRMERAGQFPKRRRLSANRVAWWEPEIEEWVRDRLDRKLNA